MSGGTCWTLDCTESRIGGSGKYGQFCLRHAEAAQRYETEHERAGLRAEVARLTADLEAARADAERLTRDLALRGYPQIAAKPGLIHTHGPNVASYYGCPACEKLDEIDAAKEQIETKEKDDGRV